MNRYLTLLLLVGAAWFLIGPAGLPVQGANIFVGPPVPSVTIDDLTAPGKFTDNTVVTPLAEKYFVFGTTTPQMGVLVSQVLRNPTASTYAYLYQLQSSTSTYSVPAYIVNNWGGSFVSVQFPDHEVPGNPLVNSFGFQIGDNEWTNSSPANRALFSSYGFTQPSSNLVDARQIYLSGSDEFVNPQFTSGIKNVTGRQFSGIAMVFSDNGPVPTYAQMNVGGMPVTNFSLPQTFSAAPEPSSLVVMGLSGFGLMVGGAIRRRRALTKS